MQTLMQSRKSLRQAWFVLILLGLTAIMTGCAADTPAQDNRPRTAKRISMPSRGQECSAAKPRREQTTLSGGLSWAVVCPLAPAEFLGFLRYLRLSAAARWGMIAPRRGLSI